MKEKIITELTPDERTIVAIVGTLGIVLTLGVAVALVWAILS